ncbi:uridine kinase [Butyricicoccus sp. 1XD8-22]|nr:uridine kinase [Butyricicoccus sp. 1XD8-22]
MHPESHALFLPVFSRIEALLQAQSNVLVAIDGRCGSGKSTLAEHLQQHWHSRLLHMDDFYLPFPERAPNWASIPCGNMDFSRFLREALLPARAGEAISYRRCDCHAGRFLAPVELPPAPLTIIEGSYSLHPKLADCYDLSIFLTCAPDEQLRRLRAREGDNFPSFPARWLPLEERYFALYGIASSASAVIRT